MRNTMNFDKAIIKNKETIGLSGERVEGDRLPYGSLFPGRCPR